MTETDPYTQAVTALMDALRTLSIFQEVPKDGPKGVQVNFDPSNISRGANYWFWVSPYVSSTESRMASRTKLRQWQIPCQIDVRYTTEAESADKLITARGAVEKLLHKPRLLKNINVNRVTVTPNSKPLQQVISEANFLVQQMTVTIEQIVRV